MIDHHIQSGWPHRKPHHCSMKMYTHLFHINIQFFIFHLHTLIPDGDRALGGDLLGHCAHVGHHLGLRVETLEHQTQRLRLGTYNVRGEIRERVNDNNIALMKVVVIKSKKAMKRIQEVKVK